MSIAILNSPELITLKICQKRYHFFTDFWGDAKVAQLMLGKNCCGTEFENFVQAPVFSDQEEIVLYYDRKQEGDVVSEEKGFKNYFTEKGYKVIENPHPSLLINVMKKLTEEKLAALNIPDSVDINLPINWSSLFGTENSSGQLFFSVGRHAGKRELDYFSLNSDGNENEYIVFDALILQKVA